MRSLSPMAAEVNGLGLLTFDVLRRGIHRQLAPYVDAVSWAEQRVADGATSDRVRSLATLTGGEFSAVPRLLGLDADDLSAAPELDDPWILTRLREILADPRGSVHQADALDALYVEFDWREDMWNFGEFNLVPGGGGPYYQLDAVVRTARDLERSISRALGVADP